MSATTNAPAATTDATLAAEGISFRVGEKWLVRDVSWTFRPGTFTALLGPNGAGKTTLMRQLSGELTPTTGHATLGGRDVTTIPHAELARRRAVLPQQSLMAFPLTVEEVVAMGRSPYGDPPGHTGGILAEVMDRVEITHLAGRNYLTLSGGERQRVQIARVLAQVWNRDGVSRVLFCDEPTNNLDLRHRYGMLKLAQWMSRQGHTVIAVLHEINDALTFADDTLMLRQGRLFQAGPTADILRADLLSELYELPMAEMVHPATGRRHFWPEPDVGEA